MSFIILPSADCLISTVENRETQYSLNQKQIVNGIVKENAIKHKRLLKRQAMMALRLYPNISIFCKQS